MARKGFMWGVVLVAFAVLAPGTSLTGTRAPVYKSAFLRRP
jgi:uncharacterized membrane protein (DUF441 family)